MTKVYLSTGSNLDNRSKNLNLAIEILDQHDNIQVLRSSSIYETDPWGYEDQPMFLNQILEIDTDLRPPVLLKLLKQVEKDVGRRPTFKYGPRIMDIDIIFYGDEVCESENLNIPHPQLEQRAFVLVPLAELIGEFIHPVLRKKINRLLQEIDISSVRQFSA